MDFGNKIQLQNYNRTFILKLWMKFLGLKILKSHKNFYFTMIVCYLWITIWTDSWNWLLQPVANFLGQIREPAKHIVKMYIAQGSNLSLKVFVQW
jgi:hypothetical protein